MADSALALPARPGFGQAGRPIRLLSNFFEVTSLPDKTIYMYDVAIDPADCPRPVNNEAFKIMMQKHAAESFGSIPIVFDGQKIAYAPAELPFSDQEFKVNLAPAGSKRDRIFVIRIKKATAVYPAQLKEFLTKKSIDYPQEVVHALEVVLRQTPTNTLISAGRGFFTGTNVKPICEGAEVWLGYQQSLRPAAGKMFVNMDMSFSAFLAEGPVLSLVEAVCGRGGRPANIEEMMKRGRGLGKQEYEAIQKKVKNLKVEIRHTKTKREFKISGLSRLDANKTTFVDQDGKTSSISQYFAAQYNRQLRFPELPLLHVKKGPKDIYLPIEVCYVVKGQRLSKKLTATQTADMIKIAAQNPKDRVKSIEAGIDVMAPMKDPFAKAFDIKINNRMTEIEARVLPAPDVMYAPDCREKIVKPRDGAWQMRASTFFKGTTVTSLAVLCLERPKFVESRAIGEFVGALAKFGGEVGVSFKCNPSNLEIMYEENPGRIEEALTSVVKASVKRNGSPPSFVLVILPRQDSLTYGMVKKACETNLDVMSQCMLSKHVVKKNPMYCKNILQKINVKLGGINNTIAPTPSIKFLLSRPSIIIGADVTHPNPGSKVPSIAAVVASMDSMGYRYATTVRAQKSRTEIIEDFSAMVKEMLISFYRATKYKPEKIMVYRDGVSEGQFIHVLEHEVRAIKQACKSLEDGYAPPVTFIVVQKRHHARFFVTDQRDADRSGNMPAGTVVDRGIVHPHEFDFYLCSHSGIQGTSRPTHYHVLYDEMKWTADQLQEFTYRMCYTYGRCTRSVSMVPAAYYAHLVAFRARFHATDNYDEWEAQSVSSGESGGMDLGFAPVKDKTRQVMYFM